MSEAPPPDAPRTQDPPQDPERGDKAARLRASRTNLAVRALQRGTSCEAFGPALWFAFEVGATGTSSRACQSLDAALVADAARAALSGWLAQRADRFEIDALGEPEKRSVPAGALSLCPHMPADGQLRERCIRTWVDVRVDGRLVTMVPVDFAVRAWRLAWVATRDLRSGDVLPMDGLECREVEVAGLPPAPLQCLPAQAQ